jgi:transcriptional regulator with XRE-family HTH domain
MININFEEMGQRIRAERIQLKMTMDKLGEETSVSRQTVSKWEKGESAPSVFDLLRLCEIFECDFGYLVGEYQNRTRVETDIVKETGLSALAVANLLAAAHGYKKPLNKIMDLCPRDRLRDCEIGLHIKIRLIELILEHADEWEKIAVCAYDYRKNMKLYGCAPLHTVGGIRHDQLAGVAMEQAKKTLADLFEKIDWDITEFK